MRPVIALIGLLVLAGGLFADDGDLIRLMRERRWTDAGALFTDGSGQLLKERFGASQAVEIYPAGIDRFTYYAKFADTGEIGTLTAVRENGSFTSLQLTPILTKMGFVAGFSRYTVSGQTLSMGDAEVELLEGSLYQFQPLRSLFVFVGSWRLQIHPSDAEEQVTLKSLVHRDSFTAQGGTLLLASNDTAFLDRLGPPVNEPLPGTADTEYLLQAFQQDFGCWAPAFREYWYYAFSNELRLLLFRNDRHSFFKYVFHSLQAPDTSLVLLPSNRFYLHYNAVQRPKLSVQGNEEIERLTANLYYNPSSGLLSATSQIRFQEATNIKTLNLAPGLLVRECRNEAGDPVAFFRGRESVYLTGSDIRKVNIYYTGKFSGEEEEKPEIDYPNRVVRYDRLFVLKRDSSYYPNPGNSFFPSRINLSLPDSLSCLASGKLVSTRHNGDRSFFRFESPGSKGVDVVCGSFRPAGEIPGQMPIRLFSTSGRMFDSAMPGDKIRRFCDFLVSRLGPLPVGELSILFRRWRDFGGQSFEGFVVFNIADLNANWTESSVRRVVRDSPVVMTSVIDDSMLHELAHQWWGGVISWRTYRDVWLTEGLAMFSTLAYWQENLSPDRFQGVLDGLRRWVVRYSDAGPIVYGQRIANLVGNYDAYQSVVYTKTALVMQMLGDIIGTDALFTKLREGLETLRFQSVSGSRFVRLLAAGDRAELLERFFRGWLNTRTLPRITWQVAEGAAGPELRVKQLDTDLVFPLELQIDAPGGRINRRFVVEGKEQVVALPDWRPGMPLQVNSRAVPVAGLDRER